MDIFSKGYDMDFSGAEINQEAGDVSDDVEVRLTGFNNTHDMKFDQSRVSVVGGRMGPGIDSSSAGATPTSRRPPTTMQHWHAAHKMSFQGAKLNFVAGNRVNHTLPSNEKYNSHSQDPQNSGQSFSYGGAVPQNGMYHEQRYLVQNGGAPEMYLSAPGNPAIHGRPAYHALPAPTVDATAQLEYAQGPYSQLPVPGYQPQAQYYTTPMHPHGSSGTFPPNQPWINVPNGPPYGVNGYQQ
ncbi:hypothetical protein VKT23_011700 [Stygiomarasmius scandens]|uniref:Uncharacterized protein n=1 Tax=Marasmiellus scandens TaxID=2682957 RepID=A0ABR1J7T1_9AGAR